MGVSIYAGEAEEGRFDEVIRDAWNGTLKRLYNYMDDLPGIENAPTPLEQGCADPAHPCILASFVIADPALKQVVAQTIEAGLRGSHSLGEAGQVGWRRCSRPATC